MSDTKKQAEAPAGQAPLHGLLAEYETPTELVEAAKRVRDAGFKKWDTFSPFPVHGIDPAMGIKPTILPWIVLVAGLTGCGGGLLLQWWTNTFDYKWLISGKPFFSIPANIPITFEMTILLSAATTLTAMLILNGLPRPHHPLDFKKRFARVTDDRFFLLIEAIDPKFDEQDTRELLQETKPTFLDEVLEDRTTSDKLPRGLVYALIIISVASLVPFGLIARARASTMRKTRIHIIPDMDSQTKYKAQSMLTFFGNDRAMRPQIPGTIAVGQADLDDHFYRGKVAGKWATTFPKQIKIDKKTMTRGQHRFGIYCTPCHGQSGNGDGMVAIRATKRAQNNSSQFAWVPPANLNQDYLRVMPVGKIFNTITHGIRNMPAYGPQIPPKDRWAIVMYVRALQRSHKATINDVPASERGSLK